MAFSGSALLFMAGWAVFGGPDNVPFFRKALEREENKA